ncbi:hypothetical protein AAVH_10277 [Aphelenchoides avenae]|nr:hypothetical protein AAVH_10277 [Aphelenchus avenae]
MLQTGSRLLSYAPLSSGSSSSSSPSYGSHYRPSYAGSGLPSSSYGSGYRHSSYGAQPASAFGYAYPYRHSPRGYDNLERGRWYNVKSHYANYGPVISSSSIDVKLDGGSGYRHSSDDSSEDPGHAHLPTLPEPVHDSSEFPHPTNVRRYYSGGRYGIRY